MATGGPTGTSIKTLQTRIIHKHDTEENWKKATNFIPKQGELIVYDIDSTYTYERIKMGDGKTLVSNLPFVLNSITDTEIDTLWDSVSVQSNNIDDESSDDNEIVTNNILKSAKSNLNSNFSYGTPSDEYDENYKYDE